MKKIISLIAIAIIFAVASQSLAAGFDEFGYNYKARIFVGKADGVDRVLDGKVWGDPTYANDHLVMKWSKAWDDARFHDAPWTCDAWEDNEWNGAVPGGSGEVWHYKIIWVGPEKSEIQGTWTWTYHFAGNDYVHTMIIDSFNRETGEFSGHGYYNANQLYKWKVTGTVIGDDISFTIIYDADSPNPGYTVSAEGSVVSMNGSATATGGQKATWTATGGDVIKYYGPCWREGGYPEWNEFEVIMDQGTWSDHVHEWFAHAIPNGY